MKDYSVILMGTQDEEIAQSLEPDCEELALSSHLPIAECPQAACITCVSLRCLIYKTELSTLLGKA